MPLARDPSGALTIGGVRLSELVREVGTPAYVYDVDAMAAAARALDASFQGAPHLVAYAVKANSAGCIVRALGAEQCGVDVVSGAELLLAIACGIAPERIVYSGVAKTDGELDRAIACGPVGIGAVQLESIEEIDRIDARARAAGRTARVSLRVNPSVDQKGVTHAHIATGHDEAKFGIPRADVLRAVDRVEQASHLTLVGMASHAGSQFLSTAPYIEAARILFQTVRDLRQSGRARSLTFVSSGGGFGIDYAAPPPRFQPAAALADADGARPPSPADFVRAAQTEQRAAGLDDVALYVEPGRSLVAPFGVLVSQTIQVKVASASRWLMIDAGMNDLIRPALYQARHRIVSLDAPVDESSERPWRVVGPVCESSDDFGTHAFADVPPGAVAILDAGAYGYVMASLYNGRQLPVEAFIRGGRLVGHTSRTSIEAWVGERAQAGS